MKKQIYVKIIVISLLMILSSMFNGCVKEEALLKATIETGQVTFVTESSAICGGVISFNGGSSISICGVCWSTSENPTTADSITTNDSISSTFTCKLDGLKPRTDYFVRAYATNSVGTSYGNQVSFTTLPTPGTVADIDGNEYHTVTIGSQVWMVENLKTTKYNDGKSISNITDDTNWSNLTTPGYCLYNNNAANKSIYSFLYNWYAVNTGKLAPTGWHVPTDDDWTTLENYLIANGYNYDSTTTGNKIAKSMAATSRWDIYLGTGTIGNDLTKNNTSGFAGLPGGYRNPNGLFYGIGYFGSWWSSTVKFTDNAWCRRLYSFESELYGGFNWHQCGFSVRCVRDN